MCPAGSSRWCPTPEQLMILEEMYRGGCIRTPSAAQIQKITAHLSAYGKIEGKNVFYWFQNHKARERQKLRRKLMIMHQQQLQHHHHQNNHSFHFLHSPALHHLSHYNSPAILHQGEVEDPSTQSMNYTWNVDIPERWEMEKSMNRTNGRDWMLMMMDVGPTPPCCNRPLKTLELFPITTTSLKEQCNTSTNPI